MITFDRQAGPLQNLNRSQVMVIGRSVSFSDPGWGRGAAQTPQNPPHTEKKKNLCMRFRTPGTFLKQKLSREKKNVVTKNFHPPPPSK